MSDARMRRDDSSMWSRPTAFVLGLLLIGAGVVLLAVNVFGLVIPIDLDQVGWPVYVIVPGLILLVVGLIASGDAGTGMSVGGAIVTTIGLILAYQRATDHWTSWAYAWALIAPTSVGAAMFLWGLLHRRGEVVRQGLSALGIGLVIFIVGFAFFEGVLNISGNRGLAPLGRQALPIALIIAGALVILSRFWPRSKPEPVAPSYAEWGPGSYGTAYAPAAEPPPPPAQAAPPTQGIGAAASQQEPWTNSSGATPYQPTRNVDEETST